MAYIICFIFSVYFLYLAEKNQNNQTNRGKYMFLAAIYPIVIAGIRDITVGIDVTWYVTPAYYAAEAHRNLQSYLKFMAEDDIGFFIYVYLVTKLTHSLTILMTLNHAIIIVPIIYALWQFKKMFGSSMWLGYAIWLLNDFNVSLCIIRQSMSLSIAILAMVMFFKKKWRLALLCSFLAISFHATTIIFIASFSFFYFLSQKVDKRWSQIIVLSSILSLLFIVKLVIGYVLPYMAEKYTTRLETSEAVGGGYFTAACLLIMSFYPFCNIFSRKKILYTQPIIYLPIIGFVIFIVSRNFQYLSRIGYPFNAMLMFSLSLAATGKYIRTSILLALFALWIVGICMRGDWETYPYMISKEMFM